MWRQFSTALGDCKGSDCMSQCGRRGWCPGGGRYSTAWGQCALHVRNAATVPLAHTTIVLGVCCGIATGVRVCGGGEYVIPAGEGGGWGVGWVMEVFLKCTASGVASLRPPCRGVAGRWAKRRADTGPAAPCEATDRVSKWKRAGPSDGCKGSPPPASSQGHERCAVPNEGALEDVLPQDAPLWHVQGP